MRVEVGLHLTNRSASSPGGLHQVDDHTVGSVVQDLGGLAGLGGDVVGERLAPHVVPTFLQFHDRCRDVVAIEVEVEQPVEGPLAVRSHPKAVGSVELEQQHPTHGAVTEAEQGGPG